MPKRLRAENTSSYAKGKLVDKVRNLLHTSGDTIRLRKRKHDEGGYLTETSKPANEEGRYILFGYYLNNFKILVKKNLYSFRKFRGIKLFLKKFLIRASVL